MRSKLLSIVLLMSSFALLATGCPDPRSVVEQIRAIDDEGGSSAWDDEVCEILLAAYDADGSDWIDTPGEVDSIPCGTWEALDQGVLEGWSYGIRVIYGFEEGYIWVGGAICFSESVRETADLNAEECLG